MFKIYSSLFLFSLSLFSSSGLAQVNVVLAPANYQFIDIGYDAVNGEVAIVGQIAEDNDLTPTVFQLNESGDGFSAETLANLPGADDNASVNSISPDAVRIAGVSSSSNTSTIEGATWLRNSPGEVNGIGFINQFTNNSSASAAWSNGVVGSSSGVIFPITWNTTDGIEILPGADGGLGEAQGVSANGCLLYTSPSPRDQRGSRMPSSA